MASSGLANAGESIMTSGTSRSKNPHGWSQGWGADPTLSPKPPSWKFGTSCFCTPSFGVNSTTTAADRKAAKFKARETFCDDLLRLQEDLGTGPTMGPGTYNAISVERTFQKPTEDVHGANAAVRRNRGGLNNGGAGSWSKSKRHACSRTLDSMPKTRLPSSYMSPGPGSYTAFTSLGQSKDGPLSRNQSDSLHSSTMRR